MLLLLMLLGLGTGRFAAGKIWSARRGKNSETFFAVLGESSDILPGDPILWCAGISFDLDSAATRDVLVSSAESSLVRPFAVQCWNRWPMLRRTFRKVNCRYEGAISSAVRDQIAALIARGGEAVDLGEVQRARLGPPILIPTDRRIVRQERDAQSADPLARDAFQALAQRPLGRRNMLLDLYQKWSAARPAAKILCEHIDFRLAVKMFNAMDLAGASARLRKFLDRHGPYAPAMMLFLKAMNMSTRMKEAREYFLEKSNRHVLTRGWKLGYAMSLLTGAVTKEADPLPMLRDLAGSKETAFYANLFIAKFHRRRGELDMTGPFVAKARNEKSSDPYLYRSAIMEMKRIDHEATLHLAEKQAGLRPIDADALTILGEALLSAGRPVDAMAVLKRARSLDPWNPTPIQWLGNSCRVMKKYDGALKFLQAAQALRPRDVWTMRQIAYVYKAMDDDKNALAWMHRALDIAPDNIFTLQRLAYIYRWKGNLKDALKYLMRAYRINPKNEYTLQWISDIFVLRKQYKTALRWLMENYANDQHDVYLLRRIADVYLSMNRPDTALEWMTKACMANPTNPTNLRRVAILNLVMGDSAKSEMYLDRCLKINPDYIPARLLKANIEIFRGNEAVAKREIDRAVSMARRIDRIDRKIDFGWVLLAGADLQRKQRRAGDFRGKLSCYTELLLGGIDLRAARPQSAIRHFYNALAEDDLQPEPHRGLALAYEMQGDKRRAAASLDHYRRAMGKSEKRRRPAAPSSDPERQPEADLPEGFGLSPEVFFIRPISKSPPRPPTYGGRLAFLDDPRPAFV